MKVSKHLKSFLDGSLQTNLSTLSDQDNKRYQDMLHRIVHEDDLINHRMGWLLTSQSILFGTYALQPSLSSQPLLHLVPWIAVSSCLFIYTSIIAAVLATRCFVREFERAFPHIHIAGPPLTHLLGLLSPVLLPLVFIGVWGWIILAH